MGRKAKPITSPATIRIPSPNGGRREGRFEFRLGAMYVRPGYAEKLLEALIAQGVGKKK